MNPVAQALLRGVFYVCVWTLVTLSCGLLGAVWPVSDAVQPGPGAGFAVLVHGLFGLCLGAGVGLIAVGSLSKLLSARRRTSAMPGRPMGTCPRAPH